MRTLNLRSFSSFALAFLFASSSRRIGEDRAAEEQPRAVGRNFGERTPVERFVTRCASPPVMSRM